MTHGCVCGFISCTYMRIHIFQRARPLESYGIEIKQIAGTFAFKMS